MAEDLDPVAHNRAAWDREVERGNEWTQPVGPDVIARARAGDWSVVLIGYEPVPRDWFPDDLAGAAVLCLASGGGQQSPVLAAATGSPSAPRTWLTPNACATTATGPSNTATR